MLKSGAAQAPVITRASQHAGVWPTLAVIAAALLLRLLTNGRYGFHRDELQFMSDARHLDWGFVAYPPVAPLLARISMTLFGLSLSGLRLFPLFAQTAALFVTALMTKELGGDRLASAAAVLGVGLAVYPFYAGTVFQYTAFDYLWWVLSEYFAVRLLTSGNPRWWPAIGASAGFGLLTKYTIAFLIAGLLCGLILTDARRYLRNGWFWCGSAIAILICLPNIYWQLRHSFVSYDFLQFIHARDISNGVTDNFLIDQPILCMNAVAAPLCLAGLVGCWRNPRYRLLAWMYIVPFGLFFIMKARSYYLAPIYPMLMAMGAVMAARWVSSPGAPLKKVAARREKGAAATEYFNPRARASHPTGNGLRGFSLPPWSFGEPGSV